MAKVGIKAKRKLPSIGPLVKTADSRRIKPPVKKADPFYLSAEWRALMEDIYRARGRQCQECGRRGCRLFGDHVIELRDGGDPLNPANVLIRCGSCHTRKTAKARAERLGAR